MHNISEATAGRAAKAAIDVVAWQQAGTHPSYSPHTFVGQLMLHHLGQKGRMKLNSTLLVGFRCGSRPFRNCATPAMADSHVALGLFS
jgi:hypothetical protein